MAEWLAALETASGPSSLNSLLSEPGETPQKKWALVSQCFSAYTHDLKAGRAKDLLNSSAVQLEACMKFAITTGMH